MINQPKEILSPNAPPCRDCNGDGDTFTGARYFACERCEGAGVEFCGECHHAAVRSRVVASYVDTCADGSTYESQVCEACARRLCGLIDLDPITADELRAYDEGADAFRMGCDSWYDRARCLELMPKYKVYLATVVCSVCHYATPTDNRVVSGAGVAHAACPERPWEVVPSEAAGTKVFAQAVGLLVPGAGR